MPKLLKTPFAIDAAEGFRTDIQESTGAAPNSATYQVGFPPVTMQSIASNGMPPKGSDLNGVLYDITDNLVFLTQGGGYGFDAAYATSIGGYPLNARLRLTNGDIVKSTINGNTNDPNVDMTGWVNETGDLIKKTYDSKTFGIQSSDTLPNALNIKNFIDSIKSSNVNIEFEPRASFFIDQSIEIDLTGFDNISINMNDAEFIFAPSAQITIRGASESPFLSTTSINSLYTGDTYITVNEDISQVSKGDLVSIKSAYNLTGGSTSVATLVQTYVVQDVDVTNKRIYILGTIVGDMTFAQLASQSKAQVINVNLYKLNKKITLKNVSTSCANNNGNGGAQFYLKYFALANISGFDVTKPNRFGINTQYCGIVNAFKNKFNFVGYTNMDNLYNNDPAAPQGQSFGYGYLTSLTYCSNFFDNDINGGWHGSDGGQGQTIINNYGNRANKVAFAFSTHENAWIMNTFGNTVVGGNFCYPRCFHPRIINNILENVHRAIIGANNWLSLFIIDNTFKINKSSFAPAGEKYFIYTGPSEWNDFAPTMKEKYIISGNIINGASATSRIYLKYADLILSNNTFDFNGGSFQIVDDFGVKSTLVNNTVAGTVGQHGFNNFKN